MQRCGATFNLPLLHHFMCKHVLMCLKQCRHVKLGIESTALLQPDMKSNFKIHIKTERRGMKFCFLNEHRVSDQKLLQG
jgi:hypothetical protein